MDDLLKIAGVISIGRHEDHSNVKIAENVLTSPTIIFDSVYISAKGLIFSFSNLESGQVSRRDLPLTGKAIDLTNALVEELHAALALSPEPWPERQMQNRPDVELPSDAPTFSLKELGL